MIRIEPLTLHRADAVDALLDAAFGADRRARPAYAIRRGMAWLTGLSYAAVDEADATLVGLLQSWPVALVQADGSQIPLVMVGPVAVLPDRQRDGIGRAMMDRLIADVERAARATGVDDPLMMIGDAPYYGRWDFRADWTAGWQLPAGVDPARLLARPASDNMAPVPAAGMLGPRSVQPMHQVADTL